MNSTIADLTHSIKVLTDPEEIATRREYARMEFERMCEKYYGMMPFNEEYLQRCWPNT